jgi:hypothetical protein
VASLDVVESYIRLGLRLGRHVDGLVDAYYGPEELSGEVESEPVVEPAALVEDADTLLAALGDGWLRDQAFGLRTYAGVLAGEGLSYSDEVEGCFGIRPQRVGTEIYLAAHERLDELLPGSGSLGERYQAWLRSNTVPAERVVPVTRDVAAELRERTRALLDLPAGEELTLEEVRDEPWWAFNYYLGGLRSRVVFNVDLPTGCDDVVELAAHEMYPGHHTEHALKEHLLVRGRGAVEETILLVPTPSALVSEGIAEIGPSMVLDGDLLRRLAGVLRRHGLDADLERARAIRAARRPLRRLGLDAALMIHEDGASPEQAQEHIERWGLLAPDEAANSVRFVTDRTWRSYVITYSAGRELCGEWVDGDPSRFVRLLTEQIRVRELLAFVGA